MSDMVCPHCRNNVRRGAFVCTGCKSEVEYGAPRGATVGSLVGAAVAGFLVGQIPYFPWWVAVLGAIAAFGGLQVQMKKYFNDRTVFRRHYRHRR